MRERITALGLARTERRADATLRPLTMGLTDWQRGSAPTEPGPASDGAQASLDEPLPRISLGPAEGGALEAAAEASQPDLTLVRTLGEGGMGRVHLARQRSLDREVAVKGLKRGATSRVAVALVREARTTGALEHPGVIPVHALGLDERGWPVLVMKRVDGAPWCDLLGDPSHALWSTRGDDEPLWSNLEILLRVCETVQFAHSRGVLHLDIKPENVMVGAFGEVYLVDWGIARRMDEGEDADVAGIVGTPAYMAPEMVIGSELSPRTDVYLLGATLHQVLTGRARHHGTDLQSVLLAAAVSDRVGYSADVPAPLADLCNRATARDPEGRPADAGAFRQEVLRFI